MGNSLFRWERRKRLKSKVRNLDLDSFDYLILTLVFLMSFVALRLFFIFEVVQAPCVEYLATIGSDDGLPSIFKLTHYIALLMMVFWGVVGLARFLEGKRSWHQIIWFLTLLLSILMIAVFTRALVPEKHINPPDGILNVALHPSEVSWSHLEKGRWIAHGLPGCVWLEENIITQRNHESKSTQLGILQGLGLGKPYIQTLIDSQTYRPMTAYERDRFIIKHDCMNDVTRYGQHRSVCEEPYLYPVERGKLPPIDLLQY
ncbi:hypothetical protein DES40_0120 [Litorimonas taeanensis]|uniref:Uncharacterized protein n=1 Tax=Litorimonas taeanensis TaxID=568099 RepID=A0A420WIQ7_9PROT|nr:hypothetical protein [Litorimonas taeanensis]RKQ70819.1 hypothetical protein DES40_0120 [Litorimonas taeanensis]